jgi:serine/threonine protein kinase
VVLRQRYVLEQPLAAGGTAIVYRARDLRRDGGLIAIKFPRPERRDHPQAVESLRREFQHAQTLSHPNIARVFDLDCDGGLWFLTLELLEGESLASLLKREREPLALRRALDILNACGEALAFAHDRGVVHGDFKPGNVFITRTGQVRVLDFGAAASWRTSDTRIAEATPPYASPEVLDGERPERRDDIFSFACVAYELLSGSHPFGRRSSSEARAAHAEPAHARNLSQRHWVALKAALSWEREQRPATARALLKELTPPPEAPTPLVIPDISAEPRGFRPPPATSLTGVLTFAILVVCALVFAYSRLAPRPDATESVGAPAMPVSAPETPLPDNRLGPVVVGPAVAPAPVTQQPKPRATATVPASASDSGAAQPQAEAQDRLPVSAALISMQAPSVVVSEGAVAAVLRLDRMQRVSGRAQVRWRTQAGTASPGKDFEPVESGTAEFADGQTMRAIYIPLRNDFIPERDETFSVELFAGSEGVRIYPAARTEVTILDDDRDRAPQ